MEGVFVSPCEYVSGCECVHLHKASVFVWEWVEGVIVSVYLSVKVCVNRASVCMGVVGRCDCECVDRHPWGGHSCG